MDLNGENHGIAQLKQGFSNFLLCGPENLKKDHHGPIFIDIF